MLLSAISSGTPVHQTSNLLNTNLQQRSEFQQLTQALQSGNLRTAQQAFSALTNNAKRSSVQGLQLTHDLNTLGSALQSGNLIGARNAYSGVQQNLQNSSPMAAHHHRPHHGGSRFLTSGFPDTSNSGSSSASQSDVLQPLNFTA